MTSNALAVVLEGREVATVDRTRRGLLRLTYSPDAGPTPVSLSMPPGGGPYTGEVVERYLRALLPENDGALTAIARRYPGTVRTDPISVLAAVGRDCPGAIQLCRPEDVDATIARTGDLIPQSIADIEMRLAAMRTDENVSWTMPGEHWSLGGTQPKFALRRDGDRWYEAHGAQPTTHIVKPGVHGMADQSLVEHVTTRAAEACGVDVAHTEHPEFGTESAIVITRFDRAERNGTLVRLHQEDMCQALGYEEKYEEAGGPSAAQIVELLRQWSMTASAARRNVARFIDGLVFTTVIAAPDAHARNYAVLLDGEHVTLAPLFDLSTSLTYAPAPGSRGRVLSMSIADEWLAEDVTREHWLRFADEVQVDGDALVERAKHILETAPPVMADELAAIDDRKRTLGTTRKVLTASLETYRRRVATNLTAR